MQTEMLNQPSDATGETVEVPAPTAWPIALAFGIALIWGGLVTSAAVSVLGAIVTLAGVVGWFRDVLPVEKHEALAADLRLPAVTTRRHTVEQAAVVEDALRAWLPVEIYPISAGLRGGLAGGIAMALLAMLYGLVSERSLWYAINLLAAGFFPASVTSSVANLTSFHWSMFGVALGIHLIFSVLVGLLYGAMLPMLPRRPILLGGFIAPILWTGIVHSVLDLVNPVLNQRIDWMWFVLSQIGFGVVAGLVVSRSERIRTWQRMPFSFRAGMEESGRHHDGQEGEKP